MPTSDQLRQFDRRAYRHTMMDGLTEIAMGLFLILVAVALPAGPFVLLLYLAPFALIPLLRSLQRRITHPRIGYVEPIADKPRQVLPGILLFTLLALAAFLAILVLAGGGLAKPDYAQLTRRLYQWAPALVGVLVSGGLWYTASRSGFRRFFVSAAVSVVLGIAISVAAAAGGIPVLETKLRGVQVYCGAMGALSLSSGLIVLIRFLKGHPIQSLEANDAPR